MISVDGNRCYYFALESTGNADVFIKPMYKQIIVHSLNHFIRSRNLIVFGWCLMPDVLHLVCEAKSGANSPIDEFSAFTCSKIIETLKDDNHHKAAGFLKQFKKSASLFNQKIEYSCWGKITVIAEIDANDIGNMVAQLDYIHSIPVKERIVQYAADYLYSSAKDYFGMPGLVDTTRLAAMENQLNLIENQKISFRANYNY